MRNILITVMMLVVVVVLFISIISTESGIRAQIEQQGNAAKARIGAVTPHSSTTP